MKRTDPELDKIREDAQKTENKLKYKRRERATKTADQTSLNERLIAPMLLLITLLISYVILLFS